MTSMPNTARDADRYCVMGNPVEHSQSPWIHARFAELTGEPVVYGRQRIELDGFVDGVRAWRAQGGRGCNITVPFKFEAAALATEVSERGQLAQACNVLSFDGDAVRADNTDGIGLVRDITQHAGVNLRGKDLLLIGAGGASAGVLGPLIEAGCARIVVARDGLGMLVEQAAEAFFIWRGVQPPAAQVLAELRARLQPVA